VGCALVLKLRGELGLAEEALDALLALRSAAAKRLDHDFAPEERLGRQVDIAKSARTDVLPHDEVAQRPPQ
jgi:hypothetical protein